MKPHVGVLLIDPLKGWKNTELSMRLTIKRKFVFHDVDLRKRVY
ncbi:MAG: hypothetical protein QXP55_01365 [Nitrososphaerales archaeon]